MVVAQLKVDAAKRLPLPCGRPAARKSPGRTAGRRPSADTETSFTAAGLKSAGLTWLFTNGARRLTGVPPLHAADANVVKSPRSIASVGTKAMLLAGI